MGFEPVTLQFTGAMLTNWAMKQCLKYEAMLKFSRNLLSLIIVFQITDEDLKGGRADRDFFAYHASTARSPVFINSREVTGRYLLDPGSYLIIPTTFEPNHQGDFIVRVYSEKPVSSKYEL